MAWALGAAIGFSPASAQIALPPVPPTEPIVVTADSAAQWIAGSEEVWLLQGNVTIVQGTTTARCVEGVLWITRDGQPGQTGQGGLENRGGSKVVAHLDGDVRIDFRRQGTRGRLADQTWLGHFQTTAAVELKAGTVTGRPMVEPAVYHRAEAGRRQLGAVRLVQHSAPIDGVAPDGTTPGDTIPKSTRRMRAFSRSNILVQAQWSTDPTTNQSTAVIDSGVNLIVDGLADFDSIDVSTDRLVIWTNGLEGLDTTGQTFQDDDLPLEIYMEGNVVFRQGDRKISATHMYYDVRQQVGIVLDAEILTPVPEYDGLLKMKAAVVRQLGRDRFYAEDAFVTSSRMGSPGYRIQTGSAIFEDHQRVAVDAITGRPLLDPETHQPVIEHERSVTSWNNLLFIESLPVFYWPVMAADLEEPSYYVSRLRIKNDSVFGTQVLTAWNGFQLLGIHDRPKGVKWDIDLDYLSDRGFGHGTTVKYDRPRSLGLEGPSVGSVDAWGIYDSGLDNLGRDRRHLVPEKDYRFRLHWQHRQQLASDTQFSAEVGWISDRNFLEQYYEREWDERKDQSTGLEFKRIRDNTSWSVTADARLNDGFTETEWLPRADHFWLGQSLLGNRLSWYEHSSAGYARMRVSSTPEDPADAASFSLLPWEVVRNGERLVTRQEIDFPVQWGPVKFVPYALGELGHWGEDINGNDLQRAYYQAGLRATMPMWKIDPTVENWLLNVHGIAHKVVFDVECSLAESNQDMADLPLYDQIDDNSIEAYRRRLAFHTFGGPAPVPTRFDERFYALRTGMAGWVTAPGTEIADDLMAVRFGARQRWQTKRGAPGSRRVIDWIELDTHATWFPKADRDNYGNSLGLVDYNFRWHVGDRLTLLSDGIFDFFDDGQQIVTVGGFLTRPPRGSMYVGFRVLEGPIHSQVLSFSYNYRMSPKWVSSFGTSIDFQDVGNIGQSFRITRIGESLLLSAGFTVDASRGNIGVQFAIEPRFLPKTRLGRVGGAQIPTAGLYGLE